MNTIEQLTVKPTQRPILSAVKRDDTFRMLTADAFIAYYVVNGQHCLGVTFDKAHAGMIKQLERFCKDVLLETATVAIPWSTEKRQIVFIHAVGNWSPICLRNVKEG